MHYAQTCLISNSNICSSTEITFVHKLIPAVASIVVMLYGWDMDRILAAFVLHQLLLVCAVLVIVIVIVNEISPFR